MTTRLDSIERSLPIMLLRARESVMRRFRPLLAEHGLSEQQWRVLRVLNEAGPMELTGLARQAVVLTPSLTRILANLDRRGLTARRTDSRDRRRQTARLTGAGRRLIATIAPESARIYEGIEREYGAARLHELMVLLRELAPEEE